MRSLLSTRHLSFCLPPETTATALTWAILAPLQHAKIACLSEHLNKVTLCFERCSLLLMMAVFVNLPVCSSQLMNHAVMIP
jgi:hypothetical protein